MPSQDIAIEAFFKQYENASDTIDPDQLLTLFADNFIVAAPHGINLIRASDFVAILPKRKLLFNQMGRQSTSLHSLRSKSLGKHYALVETTWRFLFSPRASQPKEILVDSTFLVQTTADTLKIVLYLPHEDIMTVLREHGISPTSS